MFSVEFVSLHGQWVAEGSASIGTLWGIVIDRNIVSSEQVGYAS
jgi:hypothetical protein